MKTAPIRGTQTMVVSPHYLASAAGARILEQGGNAFDAAVAVSACLAVVYPHMTSVGGDAFWLTYSTHEGRVRAYNASGRSGGQVSAACFSGEAAIPQRGARSALTVPGMVDGWDAVLREYGSMTLSEVLQPAIQYAMEGFPLSPDQYNHTRERMEVLQSQPQTAAIYLPGGKVPSIGSRFVQSALGSSLQQIAEQGRDAFYTGSIGQDIVRSLAEQDGMLTLEDFTAHTGEWVEPLRGSYRGLDIYQAPPNSQGFTGIMALQILENVELGHIPHGSYEYYHLLVEALKLSFQDRNRYLTDPDFAAIPLERLLSKMYAKELASSIDMERALSMDSQPVGSDTAYAAVVDAEGNAVSFIQSLYFEFGSAVVGGNTGILLQNRGSFFSLDDTHVNRLEPNKRTFHTLMPAMACRHGRPYILYGTQGGEGQPQTQTALLTRIVDYGLDPQAAIDAPRWVWGRTWGEATQELRLEGRISADVAHRLQQAGHSVRMMEDYAGAAGHAHAIVIDEHGFRLGGTDPRCDGAAIGW
ncbi:gamma-glutamyltransferase [Paenibacillus massiliensis]|uniref:gamma-glutamyltransferase n=1 Tax=Paenibacillus massiliensis TaxID=225917 RepID=UPI000470EC76|nr:gamma-glutamyltransferase [Paenibacillus massiliensis]